MPDAKRNMWQATAAICNNAVRSNPAKQMGKRLMTMCLTSNISHLRDPGARGHRET